MWKTAKIRFYPSSKFSNTIYDIYHIENELVVVDKYTKLYGTRVVLLIYSDEYIEHGDVAVNFKENTSSLISTEIAAKTVNLPNSLWKRVLYSSDRQSHIIPERILKVIVEDFNITKKFQTCHFKRDSKGEVTQFFYGDNLYLQQKLIEEELGL